MQVPEPLRNEITPKNILMIGPTGVGKTEIARRLAKLANAPFLKVEATKFTEVGYVGRDVDSIIRDLAEIAVKQAREQEAQKVRHQASDHAEERVLDALLPEARNFDFYSSAKEGEAAAVAGAVPAGADGSTRQKFRKMLREGKLDDREIEIEVSAVAGNMEIFGPPGMEELTQQIQGMFHNMGSTRKKTRKVAVKEALKILTDEEAMKLVNDEETKIAALKNIEDNGIVFIDEIDKIASRSETQGADVSRQGVQRDLLPLIEGTTISTKFGMVKTDHILFIASGAFHLSKPSDLIPELQGRLPIRVELASLTVNDFEAILTNTDACLTKQYQALLKTEDVQLSFPPETVKRIAEIAFAVNEKTENIGARRLYTVMEKLLEEVSFDTASQGPTFTVTPEYVNNKLDELARSEDLARYVL